MQVLPGDPFEYVNMKESNDGPESSRYWLLVQWAGQLVNPLTSMLRCHVMSDNAMRYNET